MNNHFERSLDDRVLQLEKDMEALRTIIRKLGAASVKNPSSQNSVFSENQLGITPEKNTVIEKTDADASLTGEGKKIIKNENILNKAGIGLVLFGIAFFFKYAVDQGWIGPEARVLMATCAGLAMLWSGHVLFDKKRNFSLVMTGGGIAVFYITAFSAFQLFHLVTYFTAFLCLSAITALCFFFSVKQKEAVLSLIAIAGGFATPFVLYSNSNNIPALVIYIILLLITAGGIYSVKGWVPLLWTALAGGLLCFLTVQQSVLLNRAADINDKIAVQIGTLCLCVAYSSLQPFRVQSLSRDNERLHSDAIGSEISRQQEQIPLIILILAFFTGYISLNIWTLPAIVWGSVTALLAMLYIGSSLVFAAKEYTIHYLPIALKLTGALFFVAAIVLLLSGNPFIFIMAGVAAVLHILAARMKSKNFKGVAHLLFALLFLWLTENLSRVTLQEVNQLRIGWTSFEVLWVIVLAFGASFFFDVQDEKRAYRVIAHIGLLWWLQYVISPLSNGEAYVSIAWLLYAMILLIVSLRMDYEKVQQTAMSTLLILVIKLFLIDLAELETIWRITLFLFAGTIFLLLSYYFRSLSKKKQEVPELDE